MANVARRAPPHPGRVEILEETVPGEMSVTELAKRGSVYSAASALSRRGESGRAAVSAGRSWRFDWRKQAALGGPAENVGAWRQG